MTELVLAFDAACGRCRAVAAAVADIGLTVLPLADYRVVAWRTEAGAVPSDGGIPSDGAPRQDRPTLLEVITDGPDGEDMVRAWSGPALVPTLLARLGPRRTGRLLAALRAQGVLRDALGGVGRGRRPLRRPSPGHGA